MIKIIQRVQREYDQAGAQVEDDPLGLHPGTGVNSTIQVIHQTIQHTTTSASCSTTTQLSSSATDPNDNPYQEINLDEVSLIIHTLL